MSGDAIPYHLRPHKSVDRRLFIDLLTRLERWRPLHDYAYISMGAYPLEDHKMVHRILGIRRLLAFDADEQVVKRQLFNKPVASCKCLAARSDELVDDFEDILKDHKISPKNGVIVWLDYTSPRQIQGQLREFETLIDKLKDGDVVRVTVNAHFNDYADPGDGTKPVPIKEKQDATFDRLKRRIDEYLPSKATAADMTEEGLPLILSHAFRAAAQKAFAPTSSKTFQPLSIIRYADGQQMLTMTGVVVDRTKIVDLTKRLDLKNWPFASTDWSTIHHLVVPALTLRERLFFEREVGRRPATIEKKLGFSLAAGLSVSAFLESYKNYYRFYPTLLSAEV